ncbi:hypothetical protein [Neorhizobium sp. JUb45]|uniref:hypothetical protein n=1 Tax=unclassified Neorhizobium TaxID=2629175 RepID=UPI0010E22AFE|nr:hypothetical protein [Neorhizobium sp. JUb45]TCR06870.1 hypothetical protein EDF70_101831 [Neorhizobium sp. JUb45]
MRHGKTMPAIAGGTPFRAITLALSLSLTLALCACNTTDALTPQVDVGGGMQPSNPVTQADTERMASSQQPAYRSNAYAGSSNYGNDQFPEPPSRNRRGPQNSLEAQARAIEAGNESQVASAPLDPLPGTAPASTETPANNPPQTQSAPMQANLPPTRANTTAETIRFLPIIGAPVQAVTPLSRQLGMRARAAGLTIKSSGDNSSEHILKGYLSAFPDGGGITVVYVWDILDSGGNRLNRIQGQQKVPGGGTDPWASVPAATMETIAGETIDAYMEWRHAQPG